MILLRQDWFTQKQLYGLGGILCILNAWMYECCSDVDKGIVVYQDNIIMRIFNWSIVGIKPKCKKFMVGMFSKIDHIHSLNFVHILWNVLSVLYINMPLTSHTLWYINTYVYYGYLHMTYKITYNIWYIYVMVNNI